MGGGPVKAAHHNRNGMTGRTGSLDDQRSSPQNFNAQGTSLSPTSEQDVRNSPVSNKNKVSRNNNSGSPNSSFMGSGQSSFNTSQIEKSTNR
jgi:hypothetical protein